MGTATLGPGTTSYTVPAGFVITRIRQWGGGASGGSGKTGTGPTSGGGGGSGGCVETTGLAIFTFNCSIGTGGAQQANLTGLDGFNGNPTTISTLGTTAGGGIHGGGGGGTRAGGAGGTATGGTTNTPGTAGTNAPSDQVGGNGGTNSASGSGAGSSGGVNLGNSSIGGTPGGGSGGGGHASAALGGGTAAAGGAGQIIVDYTLNDIFVIVAETVSYVLTELDTNRQRTVTRTADTPVYGFTTEPTIPTKHLHLIPTSPTSYSLTPAALPSTHYKIRTADPPTYTETPTSDQHTWTRKLTALTAEYYNNPEPTTRQKTTTRPANQVKYKLTDRATAPHVWRKGVRRTLPLNIPGNWRTLLHFTCFALTGDIGPITTYTRANGKKVFFAKYELDGKIRTPARVACRNRWRAAAAEWKQLTPTEKTNWEAVTKKLSLRLTGYNLWMWWATHQDDESINTVSRQAGIPLLPPSTRQ